MSKNKLTSRERARNLDKAIRSEHEEMAWTKMYQDTAYLEQIRLQTGESQEEVA